MSGSLNNEVESTSKNRFEIGGLDLLHSNSSMIESSELTSEFKEKHHKQVWQEIPIRVGTLLKAETVSFLLGAGVSVDCGGPLIGSIPTEFERSLLTLGITDSETPRVSRWLQAFYLAARHSSDQNNIPSNRNDILSRQIELECNEMALPVNLEKLLARLQVWLAALSNESTRLRIDGSTPIDVSNQDLSLCFSNTTQLLASSCDLPSVGREDGLKSFKLFLRKLLTRPLNLKRISLFTLNYDTLVEQAADAEGVVLLDGFVGTQCRIFRPESYEQDLYFPAETTEGRVHRFDRVVHLYKLHGSINWVSSEPSIDDPFGVSYQPYQQDSSNKLLVYPTQAKTVDTLGMPYAELFRRFASTITRPQSVLFVVGYGFGDEHVNAIIHQALAVPSFTLVIVDPRPGSKFVDELREQQDQRVWICEGPSIGSFRGFVDNVLPDLREEEIRSKVLATHRALSPDASV